MASGHEQALAMAGLGKGKVDKSLKMPKGFGVIDTVFASFDGKWKDEWKRRLQSPEGVLVVAAEWRRAVFRFDDAAVLDAVKAVRGNLLPPELPAFISAVEAQLALRKGTAEDEAIAKARARAARDRAMLEINKTRNQGS